MSIYGVKTLLMMPTMLYRFLPSTTVLICSLLELSSPTSE